MAIKVYVLADNTDGKELKGEWGLSFYIEYKGRRRGRSCMKNSGTGRMRSEPA